MAKQLISQTCAKHAISQDELTLHADRGSSMKSKRVAQLLTDLGVIKSHSRATTTRSLRRSSRHSSIDRSFRLDSPPSALPKDIVKASSAGATSNTSTRVLRCWRRTRSTAALPMRSSRNANASCTMRLRDTQNDSNTSRQPSRHCQQRYGSIHPLKLKRP
jgi:transposase InsO family protein